LQRKGQRFETFGDRNYSRTKSSEGSRGKMIDIGGMQRRGRTNVRSIEVAITLTLHAQRRISMFGEIEVEIPSNA
jgi:hypothetical protein